MATDQRQDLGSLAADRRDIQQGAENDDDDNEGNDGDNRIKGMGEYDSDGSEVARTLPQRVSLSAGSQDTSNGPQGLAMDQKDDGQVDQKDDGQGISQHSPDVSKIEPILQQHPTSDPRAENLLLELKGFLADLAKV